MKVTLDQIKEFAHSQLNMEYDNTKVRVSNGTDEIIDPWVTSCPPQELSDEEAEEYWGKEAVTEFIEKAKIHLEAKALMDCWIDVSDDLPKEAGEYFVTSRFSDSEDFSVKTLEYSFKINKIWDGDKRIFPNGAAFGELWPDYNESNSIIGHSLDNIEEVIAWMPLPGSYKRTV